jgi:serine/threonine-protein kinase
MAACEAFMIRLRALGAIDLRRESGDTVEAILRQPKRIALLTYLAASPEGQPRRRDVIVAMFWPEADEPHARDSLSAALGFLRRNLGSGVLVTRGEEEVGCNPLNLSVDVAEFLLAIDQGRDESALSLYEGDLLPGLHVPGAPGFDEWLERERARLRSRAATAATSLAERAASADRASDAARYAQRAAELNPDDEQVIRRLIAFREAAGDRAGALLSYEVFAKRLADEYDAEPSEETRALITRIRRRSEADARPRNGAASQREISPGRDPSATQPASAVPSTVQARSRSRRWRLLILPVLLAVLAVAWRTIVRDNDPPTDSRMRIAVFPFVVHGNDDLRYLEEGSMDVLSSTIDGMGELRSVDPRALMNRLRRLPAGELTPAASRAISGELSAGRYVVGSVTPLGDRIHLSARLYDRRADSEPLALADVEGPTVKLSEMYLDLARRLFAHQPVGSGDRLLSIAAVRARNHVAERAYLEGEAMMRRGAYDSAAISFTRAVEEDSTFALAWYRLSAARDFGGADPRPAADAAVRHREQLSPRDRLLADAEHADAHGDGQRADRLAREVVSAYPDNVEGWSLLGGTLWWYAWQRGGWVGDARAPLERALELDPDHRESLHTLSIVAGMERRYAEMHRLGERAYALGDPLARNLLTRDAVSAFTGGDRDAQERVYEALGRSSDLTVLQTVNAVGSWSDELDGARRLAGLLTKPADRSVAARGQGHVLLALTELAAGRRQAATKQFALGRAHTPAQAISYEALFSAFPPLALNADELHGIRERLESWDAAREDIGVALPWLRLPGGLSTELRTYLLGVTDARLGDADGALRQAVALENATPVADSSHLVADLALEIHALVASAAGDTARALAIIEKQGLNINSHYQVLAPLYERPLGRFLRAEFLHAMKRDDEALGWYATFTTLSMIELAVLAPAYLRQGEIHERQGNRALALEFYERFVNRWKDSDPEFRPLVADVRGRMERLRRNEKPASRGRAAGR